MGLTSQVGRAMKILLRSKKILPREVLLNACGICLVTEVKGAMFVSAQIGRGVLLKKIGKERFGYPSSVVCFGMGAGAQFGGERIDHILVINDSKAMQALEGSVQVRLGGEFSVTAGPSGRDGQGFASLGTRGTASMFSYSLAQGVFVGVSLEGSFFCQNHFANRKFYRHKHSVSSILNGEIQLAGESITVVEDLHLFLFAFLNGEEGSIATKIMPLGDEDFEDVTETNEAFRAREDHYRERLQARMWTTANQSPRRQSEEDDDDDNTETSSASSQEVEALIELGRGTLASTNPFDEEYAERKGDHSDAGLLHWQMVTGQTPEAFRKRKAEGPLFSLKCSHLLDETAADNADHLILSVDRGETITLLDGDVQYGLPPPYEDYVLVALADGRVGRVSKFCLEPYSSNPFPFQDLGL